MKRKSFDELLVSPVMVVDQLPANVMRALRKVRTIPQAVLPTPRFGSTNWATFKLPAMDQKIVGRVA